MGLTNVIKGKVFIQLLLQCFELSTSHSNMKMRVLIATVMTVLLSSLIYPSLNHPIPKMIDLTYDFFNLTPTYVAHKKFEILNKKVVRLSENVKYKTEEFATSEHAGTHMDAPDHFVDNRWTIDQIPIEHFVGPAVVVNISERVDQDSDALVTMEDVKEWEKENGRIPPKSIVLMYSGWGRFWRNETAYFGSNIASDLHFPGFSEEVCTWLISERSVVGVGVDTASADNGISADFPCHHVILKANGFILENVANVEQLPPSGAVLRAFPMKILGGTGAPARIIATLLPD